ncbi:MAG: hypothetical protein CMI02_19650 [Oceanospirillaceae bacterium]|nr:hypothetical protein [Oceanospirillaceae bacterium]MBT14244.1 hypothetical protein [Oceanospirillaceae bacterium]
MTTAAAADDRYEKLVNRLGWFASVMGILMFSSYIDQIRLNLNGQTGSVILPLATTVNCFAWMAYSYLKRDRDWPLFWSNSVGAVCGFATAVTALAF